MKLPELWKDPVLPSNLLDQVCNPFPCVRRGEVAASNSEDFSLLCRRVIEVQRYSQTARVAGPSGPLVDCEVGFQCTRCLLYDFGLHLRPGIVHVGADGIPCRNFKLRLCQLHQFPELWCINQRRWNKCSQHQVANRLRQPFLLWVTRPVKNKK